LLIQKVPASFEIGSIGDGIWSNSINWGNVGKAIATITIPAGASNLSIIEQTNNTTYNPQVGSRKLEQGSIATDWTPAPEDKVNVSDMRKPASDVAGIEEVNTKQDKIGYTPADDSKVAHLSGANNFDTVPTVNNNPLLLASSLPSDLARTSQQTNFTAGLQSGGVDVATAADLKSIEASAWRPLTLENANNGAILFKDNGDGTASLTGSANFVIAADSGVITEAIYPPSGYQFSSLAWNKGVNGNGIYAIGGRSGTSGGSIYTPSAFIDNGKICFKGGSYSYPEFMFSPCLNTTDKTSSSCEPAIVGITKV